MSENHTESACPLSAVDKRLDDAHRIWHRTEQSYFDPDEFRVNVQHLIQTLRSVTFVLQNLKRRIPDFDVWYATWQEKLRADPLMRWLVDARNRIEKQGDLESKSYVRAEIIASYLEEGPSIEVEAHLFQDLKALFDGVPRLALEKQILQHGLLRVDRRWVENELPDHEILDALATAFGTLHELVADAHRQMGLPEPKTIEQGSEREIDASKLGGRFPCMIAHEDPRSVLLSLRTGERLQPTHISQPFDPEAAQKAAERYQLDSESPRKTNFETVEEMANWYFEVARRMFLTDGYHLPMTFFLNGPNPIWFAATPAEDRQEKYLQMRHLAAEAKRQSADGVMMINEAWLAPAASLKAYEYPNEAADREEALCLSVARDDGTFFQFTAIISRDGSDVLLGETNILTEGVPYFYAPFFKMWGHELPEIAEQ